VCEISARKDKDFLMVAVHVHQIHAEASVALDEG
jgi:hypothetical protein